MGTQYKLLIIDDDLGIREAIQAVLSSQFIIVTAPDAKTGIKRAIEETPDLILLDILMVGMNGIEACKAIRATPGISNIPIIMITATHDDERRAEALLAGADDLVSKPFRPKEFIARILAKLGNSPGQAGEADYVLTPRGHISCGNLEIDLDKFEATVGGEPLVLTGIEVKLLKLFVKNKDRILAREQILDAIWKDKSVSDRAIDNHILSLRKKLTTFDHEIVSVYGAGYGLKSPAN